MAPPCQDVTSKRNGEGRGHWPLNWGTVSQGPPLPSPLLQRRRGRNLGHLHPSAKGEERGS
jgi:hypothetical protein